MFTKQLCQFVYFPFSACIFYILQVPPRFVYFVFACALFYGVARNRNLIHLFYLCIHLVFCSLWWVSNKLATSRWASVIFKHLYEHLNAIKVSTSIKVGFGGNLNLDISLVLNRITKEDIFRILPQKHLPWLCCCFFHVSHVVPSSLHVLHNFFISQRYVFFSLFYSTMVLCVLSLLLFLVLWSTVCLLPTLSISGQRCILAKLSLKSARYRPKQKEEFTAFIRTKRDCFSHHSNKRKRNKQYPSNKY